VIIFYLRLKIGLQALKSKIDFLVNQDRSSKEIFNKIYAKNYWGIGEENIENSYYSGPGSHDIRVIKPYIDSLTNFIKTFDDKPSLLDLGCGDFNVGSKIRPFCGEYIACDIVDGLIEFNTNAFRSINVDFRVLDITSDEIPKVDIICIRQVLQHLSNSQIALVIPKLLRSCRYLVLTEHVPSNDSYIRNIDKPTGPGTRLKIKSGVDLTAPPFNINFPTQKIICSVEASGGVIQTTVFTLII
jgi:SAM-dependent methyltransferase